MKTLLVSLFLFWGIDSVFADIILYWRFEEGEGEKVYNEYNREVPLEYGGGVPSGYINHAYWATNVPVTTIPFSGETNTGALQFGGAGTIQFTVESAPLYFGNSFTVECYFLLTDILIAEGLLSFSSNYGGDSFGLSFWNVDGDVLLRAGLNGKYSCTEPVDINFNEWYHYAFVKDDDWMGFYLDGILVESFVLPDELAGAYTFGAGAGWDSRVGPWRGYLDEVRISDEALEPWQFLNAAAVPEPGTLGLLALGAGALAWRRRKRKT